MVLQRKGGHYIEQRTVMVPGAAIFCRPLQRQDDFVRALFHNQRVRRIRPIPRRVSDFETVYRR